MTGEPEGISGDQSVAIGLSDQERANREVAHSLTPEQVRLVLAQAPAEDLMDEVLFGRGPNFMASVLKRGLAAQQAIVPSSYEDRLLQRRIQQLIDPDTKLSATEQLETMDMFYARLGIISPELNVTQQEQLTRAAKTYPDRSIVPTPLSHIRGRIDLARRTKQNIAPGSFKPRGSALWWPGKKATYGKLLLQPDDFLPDTRDPSRKSVLRHKTPTGELMGDSGYRELLLSIGQAIRFRRRTWTYPISDVQVDSKRTDAKAGDLFKQIDPLLRPESLIVTYLLHAVVNQSNIDWSFDLANEGIYLLGEDDQVVEGSLYRVNGTKWDYTHRQIHSGGVDINEQTGRFVVRRTTSALDAIAA